MRAGNLRKRPSSRRFQVVLVDNGRGGGSIAVVVVVVVVVLLLLLVVVVVSRRLEYGQLQLTSRLSSALQDRSEMPLPHVREKVAEQDLCQACLLA